MLNKYVLETAGSSPLTSEKVIGSAPITAEELGIELNNLRSAATAGTFLEDFLDFLAMGERD